MLLYVHIPFCSSKCGYCAFNSYVGTQELYGQYIKALCQDLHQSLKAHNYPEITSVFFGGGTPNLLDFRFYDKVFESFLPYVSRDCEITLECNVNLLRLDWCKHLKTLGANRLSIGVQSFSGNKLTFLEREHKVSDIFQAYEHPYNAGFRNLGCDIIIGTPLDTKSILEQEIHSLAKLPLTHVSVYELSIDEGSRFANDSYSIESPQENLGIFMREGLSALGFEQYEVSNYAKEQYYCKHNLGYWEAKEYIGCGAGAFSRIGTIRSMASKALQAYIQNPYQRKLEVLHPEDLRTEEIMLGLRCKSGVRKNLLDSHKCQELIDSHILRCEQHQGESFILANELFLADEIALRLI